MPTGAGKTATVAELIRQILRTYPEYRVLAIVPKLSIISSFERALKSINISDTDITVAAESSHGKDLTGQFVIGSYQTLVRQEELPAFDLVIADEAHKINEEDPKSQYVQLINRLMASGHTRLVALTATPFRDTGFIYGQGKMFEKPVFTRDLLWTTEQGFTVKARLYHGGDLSFDTSKLRIDNTGEYAQKALSDLLRDHPKAEAQINDIIKKSHNRNKIAIACSNIEHAELVATLLSSRGEKCSLIHSQQDFDDRELSLGDFAQDSDTRFLVFVSIVAEGFDYPPIDCIALLRPTRRANLYVQIVGRGLRPSPTTNKRDCLVLDYGRVIENCGPLNAPFVSEGGKRGLELATYESDVLVVTCDECGAFYFPLKDGPEDTPCPYCNSQNKTVRTKKSNLDEEAAKDVELYSITPKKKKWEEKSGVVFSFDYLPCGFDSEARRKLKRVVFRLEGDPKQYSFFINNPNFMEEKKFWQVEKAVKLEPLYERFLHALMGQPFDIRSTAARMMITPPNRVELTFRARDDGISEYLSHQMMPGSLKLKTKGKKKSPEQPVYEDEWASSARRVFGNDTTASYHGCDDDEGATG